MAKETKCRREGGDERVGGEGGTEGVAGGGFSLLDVG